MKVLVVDDSETVRSQVGAALNGQHECVFAESAAKALEIARRDPPDAMISDLEMPYMDGAELLREVRQDPQLAKLPVIIITSVMSVDQVNACRRLGCSGFVLKPIQPDYLLAKLKALSPKKQ